MHPLMRLFRAGLLTGVIDGLWAVVLTMARGRSVEDLWRGVAAVPFGKQMLDGGAPAVALGVAVHFCVAFAWSAVFLLLFTRSRWLAAAVQTRYGLLETAAVYGPLIWIVMSLIVIPAFTGTPTTISGRWWIQLAGHVVFVGLPIVWGSTVLRPAVLAAEARNPGT
jgi:hypothetical protein